MCGSQVPSGLLRFSTAPPGCCPSRQEQGWCVQTSQQIGKRRGGQGTMASSATPHEDMYASQSPNRDKLKLKRFSLSDGSTLSECQHCENDSVSCVSWGQRLTSWVHDCNLPRQSAGKLALFIRYSCWACLTVRQPMLDQRLLTFRHDSACLNVPSHV